ncbi:MAG: TetR/AcrR family transcriptional regulator [Desulfobacter sp.]|nr:TetR/AcrR family transcriptional regulator [Desulfobacter sp.]WDP85742.1 MAG: TetR/AcrR family transcriptional regulator [Desulfobacter sp.]
MALNHEQKKEKIIHAAGIVFSKKGFHQAKMDEIAQLAQVAKGTLYYNYSSKSKLFGATVTQGLNQIMTTIEKELESDLPFLLHFKSIVSTMIRLYIANGEVTQIYANEMSSGIDDQVRVEIKGVRHQFNTFIETLLKEGQEKGYLGPLPPHLSAMAIIGIIDSLCSHYLENPDQDSMDKIIETVFTILSAGLVSPKTP